MDKQELRRTKLAARAALSPDEYRQKSECICARIAKLKAWSEARAVLFYLPFRNEVDVEPLLKLAWQQAKRVFVPRCVMEGRQLQVVALQTMEQLRSGAYSIREPAAELTEGDPHELDLILVPGSVYDRAGGRMGYGAGYYDRFLPCCRADAVRLAPLFALQFTEHLPQEPFDQPMDLLVSEESVIHLTRG